MKSRLLTFFILLSMTSVFAQNTKEQLLIDQLQTTTADSTKIRLTRELAASLSKTNMDLAKHYANECLNLSLKTGNKSGEAFSYNLLGGLHLHQNEYLESMELYLKALRIFTELDDKRQISAIYSNIGTLYTKQGNLKEARKYLESSIDLKEKMDLIEYRFAVNEISRDIFERQNQKLKESMYQKMIEIENLPTKKSNQEKAIKYFTKIAVNPSEFYENLEYNQKRVLQKLLFPEGLQYSLKNKEYLTSKTGALFELTNCFSNIYVDKIKKTYQENPDKSHLVPGVGIEPTHLSTRV